MDYKRIYNEFIADRRGKEADLIASGEYFERHHILPKSMGGGDEAENLVALSAIDHLFAHFYLAKWLGNGKAWHAVKAMLNMRGSSLGRDFSPENIDPEIYAEMRQGISQAASESAKRQHENGLSKLANSAEACAKRSASMKAARKANPERWAKQIEMVKNPEAIARRAQSLRDNFSSGKHEARREQLRKRWKDNPPMHDEAVRAKVAAKSKEYCNRPEVRAKRSEAIKGDKNPAKRPEVAAKIKAACAKRDMKNNGRNKAVVCLENGKVFRSASEASKWCGSSKVSSAASGRRPHAGGYRWAYVDAA